MPLKVKMLHSSLNQLLDYSEPYFVSSILKYPDMLQREDVIMVFIVLCSPITLHKSYSFRYLGLSGLFEISLESVYLA